MAVYTVSFVMALDSITAKDKPEAVRKAQETLDLLDAHAIRKLLDVLDTEQTSTEPRSEDDGPRPPHEDR